MRTIVVLAWLLILDPGPLTAQEPPAAEAKKEAEKPKESPTSKSPRPKREDNTVRALLMSHNRERAKQDLPPLTLDEDLSEAARAHALDLSKRDELSHTGSDGSQPADRIKRAGYKGRRMGENVAFGQRDVRSVTRDWMNSPGHKANILGEFDQMGAALVRARDGKTWWAVTFGQSWPTLDVADQRPELLEAVNAARKRLDKPALELDAKLGAGCQEQAEAMAAGNKKPIDLRAISAGTAFRSLGAFAMTGPTSAEQVVEAMQSDGPLGGEYSHLGVGVAAGEDRIPRWILVFAKK